MVAIHTFSVRKIALFTTFLFITFLQGCDNAQRLEHTRLEDFARFGRSVDLNLGTAAVGAYLENTEEGGEGAVYLYSSGEGTWSIQHRILSPSPGDEQFGNAVALWGNFLAVGAHEDHQVGAVRSGSVYIFQFNSGAWTHIQTLSSPGGHQAWEAFGISLDMHENTLVVGAVDRDQGALTDAGAAFVYEWTGSSFSLISSLAAPFPAAFDKFGSDVSIFGDTIAVSAPHRDTRSLGESGVVYIYERSGTAFTHAQTLSTSDKADDDRFGTSVSVMEYSDGSRRLAVGAFGVDQYKSSNVGAAYVFDALPAAGFSETTKLIASDASAYDSFGTDVSLWENTIAIGASGENSVAVDAGAAYVFELQLGTWTEVDKLTVPDAHYQMFMGSAVAIMGDTVFAGATGAETGDIGLTDTGAVEVFRQDSLGNWNESLTLTASGKATFDGFGTHISASGSSLIVSSYDYGEIFSADPDGYALEKLIETQSTSQIKAAALNADTAVVFGRRTSITEPIGYLDIYTETNGLWSQQQLIDPDLVSVAFPQESANSPVLDLDGDTLVLGARRWNLGDGRVFIYDRVSGVWSLTQLLTSAEAASNFDRNFGNHVALDGDWLAIAEVPSSGIPGSDMSGAVHLYRRIAGTFNLEQTLAEPIPSNTDGFGRGLAIHNDLLATYTASNSMLRVYLRTGINYSEVWNTVVANAATIGDVSLFIDDNIVAIGAQGADYDGFTNAGEVQIFERQVDDSYIAGDIFRPSAPSTDMNFGRQIDMKNGKLFVSTGSNESNVHIFDL